MKPFFLFLFIVILGSCHSIEENGTETNIDATIVVATQPVDAQLTTEDGQQVLRGPSVLSKAGHFIWGGSAIRGDDGRYHLFFSTWDCGPDSIPFTQSWVLHSGIGYAVSDHPDRDFKFQKVFLKGRRHEGEPTAWDAQMTHNPHIQKFNGKYYLYYIGARDPGQAVAGEPGHELSKRDRVQQSQHIGVIIFNSFEDILNGNFERPDRPILSPRTRVKPDKVIKPSPAGTAAKPDNLIVTNPSVVYRPSDGKYLLYFKGNVYTPNWRGIHGVAIGDDPGGPFTARDEIMFDIKMEDGTTASTEDPYVWYHPGKREFYAVVKDFSGRICGKQKGLALLRSPDGLKWTPGEPANFMNREVPLKDGRIIQANRLERPQLLINEQGFPEVFYGACAIDPANKMINGGTFNVHIPLVAGVVSSQ